MSKKVLSVVCGLLLAGSVSAAELSYSVDPAVYSTYVWRGLALTDGPVFQLGLTAAVDDLSLNIWGNLDLDDVNNNEGEFNELDYTLNYDFAAGDMVSMSVGAIRYTFPNTAFGMTTEVYVGASFDVPLAPSITLYQDVDAVEGMYGSVAAGYGFEMPSDGSLDLGLTVSFGSEDYNMGYYGAEAGLTDMNFSVGYSMPLNDSSSLSISVLYSTLLGDPADVMADDSFTAGGIAYSLSF